MTDSRCAPRGGMVRGRGGSDDSETVVGSSLFPRSQTPGIGLEAAATLPRGLRRSLVDALFRSRVLFLSTSGAIGSAPYPARSLRLTTENSRGGCPPRDNDWITRPLVTGDSHSKKISRIPRVGGTARADASFRGRVHPNGDGKRLMRISAEGLETGSHATSDRGRSHLENLLHSSVPTPLNALRHMTNR